MILWQLFLSFAQVGLFAIGGGYAAMPLIQAQVTQAHAWLTPLEFADLVTLAEMTPGPIAINAATFVGTRLAGATGAAVATLGCVLPSVVLVSALSFVYLRWRSKPLFKGVLGCLRAAVAALIAAAGLTLLRLALFGASPVAPENLRWLNLILFAGALAALRRLRWNPILTLLLCGAVGVAVGVATGMA